MNCSNSGGDGGIVSVHRSGHIKIKERGVVVPVKTTLTFDFQKQIKPKGLKVA